MILYSIRRKCDKKMFGGWRWDDAEIWNDKGTLYRTVDAAIRNLKWICSDEIYNGGNTRRTIEFKRATPAGISPQRLKAYEVFIYDVRLNKPRKTIPAIKFYKDINP